MRRRGPLVPVTGFLATLVTRVQSDGIFLRDFRKRHGAYDPVRIAKMKRDLRHNRSRRAVHQAVGDKVEAGRLQKRQSDDSFTQEGSTPSSSTSTSSSRFDNDHRGTSQDIEPADNDDLDSGETTSSSTTTEPEQSSKYGYFHQDPSSNPSDLFNQRTDPSLDNLSKDNAAAQARLAEEQREKEEALSHSDQPSTLADVTTSNTPSTSALSTLSSSAPSHAVPPSSTGLPPPAHSDNNGSSVGLAIGIIMAVMFCLGLVFAFFFLKRRKQRTVPSSQPRQVATGPRPPSPNVVVINSETVCDQEKPAPRQLPNIPSGQRRESMLDWLVPSFTHRFSHSFGAENADYCAASSGHPSAVGASKEQVKSSSPVGFIQAIRSSLRTIPEDRDGEERNRSSAFQNRLSTSQGSPRTRASSIGSNTPIDPSRLTQPAKTLSLRRSRGSILIVKRESHTSLRDQAAGSASPVAEQDKRGSMLFVQDNNLPERLRLSGGSRKSLFRPKSEVMVIEAEEVKPSWDDSRSDMQKSPSSSCFSTKGEGLVPELVLRMRPSHEQESVFAAMPVVEENEKSPIESTHQGQDTPSAPSATVSENTRCERIISRHNAPSADPRPSRFSAESHHTISRATHRRASTSTTVDMADAYAGISESEENPKSMPLQATSLISCSDSSTIKGVASRTLTPQASSINSSTPYLTANSDSSRHESGSSHSVFGSTGTARSKNSWISQDSEGYNPFSVDVPTTPSAQTYPSSDIGSRHREEQESLDSENLRNRASAVPTLAELSTTSLDLQAVDELLTAIQVIGKDP